ncbi:hypothetical protein FPV67DRAFT_1682225 [Lyophyllum atratum]|nr:hypothetical protein FPV67DRAFT_1682225 [Lyophyllum atratum]
MPRRWTTDAQAAWLGDQLPGFLDAQKTGQTGRFELLTAEAWFKEWPLDDTLEGTAKNKAVTDRKQQLRRWFFWHSKPANRAISAKTSALFRKPEAVKTRVPKAIHAYQHLYKEKTVTAIQAALLEAGKIDPKTRLAIIKRVPEDMLAAEEKNVLDEVAAYIKDKRVTRDEERRAAEDADASDSASEGGRTPSQYHAAIQQFPAAAQEFLQAAAEATGWVIHLVAAGPNPVHNGDISSIQQNFGPTSIAGNTFQQAHAGYIEHIQDPFLAHVKAIFPHDIRRNRSLIAEQPPLSAVRNHGGNKTDSPGPPSVNFDTLIPLPPITIQDEISQPSDFAGDIEDARGNDGMEFDWDLDKFLEDWDAEFNGLPNPTGELLSTAPQAGALPSAGSLSALLAEDWPAQFGPLPGSSLDPVFSIPAVPTCSPPPITPSFQQTLLIPNSVAPSSTPFQQLPLISSSVPLSLTAQQSSIATQQLPPQTAIVPSLHTPLARMPPAAAIAFSPPISAISRPVATPPLIPQVAIVPSSHTPPARSPPSHTPPARSPPSPSPTATSSATALLPTVTTTASPQSSRHMEPTDGSDYVVLDAANRVTQELQSGTVEPDTSKGGDAAVAKRKEAARKRAETMEKKKAAAAQKKEAAAQKKEAASKEKEAGIEKMKRGSSGTKRKASTTEESRPYPTPTRSSGPKEITADLGYASELSRI